MSSPYSSRTASTIITSGNSSIDALLGQTFWGIFPGIPIALSFSFPWTTNTSTQWQSGYSYDDEPNAYSHYGFDDTQVTATREALQSWGNVANISFTEVEETDTNVGDIRFAFSSAVTDDAWGWAYSPETFWASSGDVWLNTTVSVESFAKGTYDYNALIHELGHALGLKHPGNYNGANGTTDGPYLPAVLDNRLYSIMSYNEPSMNLWLDTLDPFNIIYPNDETPMVFDIAAIQYLYGANMTYQTGDNTYSFDDRSPFRLTLWDAGGIDTISEAASSRACYIDLTPGAYSTIQTDRISAMGGINSTLDGAYNLGIAYGAIIENATGGSASDKLYGNDVDNILIGNGGNDSLVGELGNDTLDGGAGTDSMLGGAGDDTYVVDSTLDKVYETTSTSSTTNAGGTDTINSSISYTLGIYVENLTLTGIANINGTGNTLSNTLIGNSGNNILDGKTGVDSMIGGAGNDTYMVDNANDTIIENILEGTDTVNSSVSYVLSSNIEMLILSGLENINATGSETNNILIGNSGVNILRGEGGNDILMSGGGADILFGGSGDDTYSLDSTSTSVYETIDILSTEDTGGLDTVSVAFSYTLGNYIERLTLTGTSIINATGNNLNNILMGNKGVNILDGLAGADTMLGGEGSDTYIVDDLGDSVIENGTILSTEIDTVKSSVDFTLGINLERVILTSSNDINATGNTLANTLTGNSGANVLDGGAGADTMIGGTGNDTYIVDNIKDVVTETSTLLNEIDTINSFISYTVGNYVENLTLTGTVNINATGNTLANTLIGNSGNNTLDGKTGADNMSGELGNDTYYVENVGDIVTESSALLDEIDTVNSSIAYILGNNLENLTLTGTLAITGMGNALNNILTGNSGINTLTGGDGNDTLNGGAGADILFGGAGDDIYTVDNVGDKVYETTTATSGIDTTGIDRVNSSITYILGTYLENLTLAGTLAINGIGNAFDNTLIGNNGANLLDGLIGADSMNGGLGNDTYIVDDLGDTVTEESVLITEIDTVKSSVSFTLGTNLEKLTLTGTAAIDGTGNGLVNTLTGNMGANVLDGGAGADTMIGGAGNDTYVVDNIKDVVRETTLSLSEIDTVNSFISYTLGNYLENLILTATANINATGNTLTNILVGNIGNNLLNGKAGNDILTGGLGNDIFVFNTALNSTTNKDTITDFTSGEDIIQLENAIFTKLAIGSFSVNNFVANDTGTASDINDYIIYNTSNGILSYDADAIGAGAALQIALLGTTNHPMIVYSDLMVS